MPIPCLIAELLLLRFNRLFFATEHRVLVCDRPKLAWRGTVALSPFSHILGYSCLCTSAAVTTFFVMPQILNLVVFGRRHKEALSLVPTHRGWMGRRNASGSQISGRIEW